MLETLIVSIDSLFARGLRVIEPPLYFKEKLDILEDMDLRDQRSSLIFEMRNWQISALGFSKIDFKWLVKELMGNEYTDEFEEKDFSLFGWTYNHHTDEELKTWQTKQKSWQYNTRPVWFLPPFFKKTIWIVTLGVLPKLKKQLSYDIVQRISECKKTKLFNTFTAIGPAGAWENNDRSDKLVVLANVYEMPYNEKGHSSNAGKISTYFLGIC